MKKEKNIEFEVRALNNLIKRDIERNMGKKVGEPTRVHGWAIGYFYDNSDRDVFQRDFEEHFSIRRSTATRILQLMEKNGLIVRESVKQDARLKKITLTEKARSIHKSIIADIDARQVRITRGLSTAEVEAFLNTLNKLKANLEDSNV